MGHPAVQHFELAAMRSAIEIAGTYRPHPNPKVGAVVLDRSGTVVGRGAHEGPGSPHAETIALQLAGERAEGGTVIVTLEPCSHHGRTPPCTDALISAGVGRVVAALTDPDERVTGSGFARLREAGIEVVTGVLETEATALDPGYLIHRRLGRPRVVIVSALTLDGQSAALDDGPTAELLSGACLDDMSEYRTKADAVVIGSGFVRSVRANIATNGADRPRTVVVTGRRFPQVDVDAFPTPPIVFVAAASDPHHGPTGRLEVVLPTYDGLKVDLEEALAHLGDEGLLDVHIEGGQALISSFERLGLVDEYRLYLAAHLAGGVGRSLFDTTFGTMREVRPVEVTEVRQIGDDLAIHARVQEI